MASEAKQKLKCDLLTRTRLLAERDVVEEFVKDYDHIRDSSRNPVHLENLNRIWQEFADVQSRIELEAHLDRLDSHLEVRAEFFNQFCKLKGFLLSRSNQNYQSHVTSSQRQQPTVLSHPRTPQKEEEAANVVVAGPSQDPVASAATPPPKSKPEPNAPEPEDNVSPRRHLSFRCPTPDEQAVLQRHQELASERSLCRNPEVPDLHAQERSSCGVGSRPPEEEASTREVSNPIVRSSHPKKEPIPATSAHVRTSGSANPVGVSLSSQVKATPVQGEEVRPPVVDLYEKETLPEATASSATLSTPKGASSVAAKEEFASHPESKEEEEEDVVRHADPTDVGNPEPVSAEPEVSAEKILRKREEAATSTPTRRKITPFTEPQAVPNPSPAEVSAIQPRKHLSIGDGLPLEIGRIESHPARASFANDAHLYPVSQPPNPSHVRSLATLAAQPFCESPRGELPPTRIRPGKHTKCFRPHLCPLVTSRCSHTPANARVRCCRVRRERTAPTVHRQNRFPCHASPRSKRTDDPYHYHATNRSSFKPDDWKQIVVQPGIQLNPTLLMFRLKPRTSWDYELPQKPPDERNVATIHPLPSKTIDPPSFSVTRHGPHIRTEQFSFEKRCHHDRAPAKVAAGPAHPPHRRGTPIKPHPKHHTIVASPAAEAQPSSQPRRWRLPPWPSEDTRRSWHTAAPLETTETLHEHPCLRIAAQVCSEKPWSKPEIPERNSPPNADSTKTGRADRI